MERINVKRFVSSMGNIVLAGCIIIDNEGRLLLLHRNTPKRKQWETPGGKVREGESAVDAARREAQEELGVSVKITKELGRRQFTEDGYVMEYIWFLAVMEDNKPIPMETTHDDLRFFTWEELRHMTTVLSPNVRNLVEFYFAGELGL
jgi:8-oxo-dGTP diphosphatase